MPTPPLLLRLARGARGLPLRVRLIVLGLSMVTALAGWSTWRSLAPDRTDQPDDSGAAVEDPRLTFATPFRNVRPDVRYTGDGRCGECHTQAATYHRHPMGRSLAPAADVADRAPLDRASHNPFERAGFSFRVERRGPRLVHSATRRPPGDKGMHDVSEEVAFAVGSGTNGRSFLVNHDGYLFQSPITWFPRVMRWDLSPGYAAATLFDRPIKPGCLFCHTSEVRPVEHSVNRYEEPPLFRGHAIGCERCHGPAELHLRERDAGPPAALPDTTIVNPARLRSRLRDAVCEQCHLQGESHIVRRGRGPFDYRPGLPLHLFWSVFVRPPESREGRKFVGHVEQMRSSLCATRSGGKLGCTSCHDPHELPEPAQRVAYYRRRCQECHEQKPCVRRPPPAGDESHPSHAADDCVACHMPRRHDTEIIHASVVDHRVMRRPEAAPLRTGEGQGQPPLVLFHEDLEGGRGPEARRDLGLAMIDTAQRQALPPWARVAVGRLAEAELEGAVGRSPGDVPAREGRGLAFAFQGDARRALADFEAVLERVPHREVSLVAAADTATALKDDRLAEGFWRRALTANPWTARSHVRLAEVLARGGRWPEAQKECRAALRLNPARGDARRLLIAGLLRTGELAGAEVEFHNLLADHPGEGASLREWWRSIR